MFHNKLFRMKKMRLHNLVTTLVLVCMAAFWGCSSDDVDSQGPFIKADPTALAFEATTGDLTKILKVESNREWTAAFIESDVDSWITIDTKKGSGNGAISVTVLPNDGVERSATLKLTASTVSVNVKITQTAEGSGPVGEILYKENVGKDVYKINAAGEKDDKGSWPKIDQYTQFFNPNWEKGGSLDQSGVTYTGTSSNVSNSGNAFSPGEGTPFSDAPYVGMNTAASLFTINSINITGQSNFTFKFGAVFQSNYQGGSVFGEITTTSFNLSASVNGTDWAPLTYTVAKQGAGSWYLVTTEFKVPVGSTKLYIQYATPNWQVDQGYRFDDFTLYQGGNGQLIDPNGGGEVPGEKTYITVAQLRAKGEMTISENLYVKASVISDNAGGNSTSRKNVVISDGEAGIAIRFTADADYAVGTELELKLNGAQLAKYQGLLQLNNFNNANVATTGQMKVIVARPVTAADVVANTYESMYVAVADVQVVNADLTKKMVVGDNHTNIGMEARTGQEFAMFTSKYAAFKDANVPQGSGTLKGIAGINIPDGGSAVYQIAPQTVNDFAGLTEERFGAQQSFSFGTPAFNATTIKVGTAIVGGKITIPYFAATGTESYNITVAVSGAGADGIDQITTAISKTLTAGNGSIEIPITGTPTTAGSVTFTISGVTGLTTTTATGTVTADGGAGYTSNVSLPTADNTTDANYGQKANIDGTEYSVLKLGTSSKVGKYTTESLPKTGNVTLSFYGVAWKGKAASVKITVNGGGTIDGAASKTFDLVGNDGATGNPTYTITFAAGDVYSANLQGVTASTTLTIESIKGTDSRAILAGINVN